MIRPIYSITALILLVACASSNGTRDSILSGFYKYSTENSQGSRDDALSLAAFDVLSGMTRSDAVRAMQRDGFSCVTYTCKFSSLQRDSTFEILAGSSPNIRDRSSILGERYSFQHTFEISILSETVVTPDNISAKFHQTHNIVEE